jgi:hypothetical protein
MVMQYSASGVAFSEESIPWFGVGQLHKSVGLFPVRRRKLKCISRNYIIRCNEMKRFQASAAM